MSDGTKERLLDAAIEQFAINGFEGATIREICRRAGANVNAVKYYFEDKRGLHVAAVTEAHRRVTSSKPLPELPSEGSAEERLRSYIRLTVEMVLGGERGNQPHHMLMSRELADPSEVTEQFFRKCIQPRFRFLDTAIAELLPPGTPELDRRLLVFSVVGQCMHYRFGSELVRLLLSKRELARLTPEKVADHITGVILAAIDQYQKKPDAARV